jgi:hypothetical protein
VSASNAYYPSGTFGGGGIGKPLLLIPAISTYPLTAALRDDLLSRVKMEQQSSAGDDEDQSQGTGSGAGKSPDEEELCSCECCDPKDAGALLSTATSNNKKG